MQWITEARGGEVPQPFSELDQFWVRVMAVPPQICFIRLGSEGIPGLQAAALVRNHCPDTRVVLVADSADYAITAYELGAYGYLLSPVKQDKLRRLLLHAASSS